MTSIQDFLRTVITCPEPGYFCLALKGESGAGWLEEWYQWPDDIDRIEARALHSAEHANVYFSSYLFRAPQSVKSNALPTRTIQADLDDADLSTVPVPPSVLVQTSPGRHQGYWILSEEEVILDGSVTKKAVRPLEEHELLSKKVTYSIPACDKSGWPIGRKVRIPFTKNYKYLDGTKDVRLLSITDTQYSPDVFETLPEVPAFLVEHYDPEFLENPPSVDDHPLELLEKIRNNIPFKVYASYSIEQEDRSEALWALTCAAFKAGLNRDEVFTLAKGSANNKFADLRQRGDQELAKDVLRAEQATKQKDADPRQTVYQLFKKPLPAIDRRRAILDTVLKVMQDQGVFLHTRGGTGWYVRRDVGRPVLLTPKSLMLHTLLDVQFGLNATEEETRYTVHGLIAHVSNLPEGAVQAALSYYDPVQRHVLLHTGRKHVLRITASSIEPVTNGAYDVLFPWSSTSEEFSPLYKTGAPPYPPCEDWAQQLFADPDCSSVDNLTNMTPEQALSLLTVWFMFVMFRSAAGTRPILAALGQPGSGKSLLFKKIYAMLYGRYKSLLGVTTMEDFDYATASDPVVSLDNVDSWQPWLPDRLALAAGVSDIVKRRLYTDADTIVLRRNAMLGVTAHNPKFGREDVADRFLLLAYKRLENFASESSILDTLWSKRNKLWGGIVRDIQRVLHTPMPAEGDAPQFRIEDFARVGTWIARALGIEDGFRDAVQDVRTSQQVFSMEEEGQLVDAVLKYAAKVGSNGKAEFRSAAHMWSMLEAYASDPRTFSTAYRNSTNLSKKLSSMQNALSSVVRIETSTNEAGARTWLIAQKEQGRD